MSLTLFDILADVHHVKVVVPFKDIMHNADFSPLLFLEGAGFTGG